MSGYVAKAATAETVATVDWRQGYLEPGEFVDGDLGWSVEPAGTPVDAQVVAQTFDDCASHARVAKGLPGQTYMLSARAVTNTGRTLERSIVLRIAA